MASHTGAHPAGDHGVVRVGDRHYLLTDPEGGASAFRFWIPRPCTRIEELRSDDTDDPHAPTARTE